MKIIITGTTGFIGSRLLQAATLVYGASVTALSSRPTDSTQIGCRVTPGFSLNLLEQAQVENAEVLIHAGAFTPKSGTEANKIASCNSNITATEQLLALPWLNLKKIIFLSSIDVYAIVESIISEATPTAPPTLYGLSKLYSERMISLFAADRGIASQVLRVGHVFGPGEEKYAKVLPKAIQNIVAGKDIELWGDGNELRSFIYIDDVVTAILEAVDLQNDLGEINVVSGNSISIRELLNKLIAIGGRSTRIVQREFSGPSRDLVFDASKLKQFLLPEETDFTHGLQTEFRYFENLSASR